MKRIRYYFVALILISLIASCGYKIRDSENAFIGAKVILIYDPKEINQKFINQFQESQNYKSLLLNNSDQDADIILRVINQTLNRYSLALNENLEASEARLEYKLEYSIRIKGLEENFFQIKLEKPVLYNESRIMAMENKEELLLNEFIKDAISLISLTISSL